MIPSKFSLENKTALIVGTGYGWHRDLAMYLYEAGANVAVVVKDDEYTNNAEEELKSLSERCIYISMDLTDNEKIEKTIDEIIVKYGPIDILVNNIFSPFNKPFLEMTTADWERIVSGNLASLFQWTQAVGRHMLKRKQGRIINISSILSERGLPNSTAYCAACGGIDQLTKALALEWVRQNITVNAIGVGWVGDNSAEGAEAEERLRRYITLRRFCRPDDIAAILVYLASSSSSYVTGQTYFVSGGVMSHG